jgi:predicted transport protein
LDSAIEAAPKKFYIAYKISQNIVCMEVQKNAIRLYLKLRPTEIKPRLKIFRDVTDIGHYGTGDAEFTCRTRDDFESMKPFVEMAYNKVGG